MQDMFGDPQTSGPSQLDVDAVGRPPASHHLVAHLSARLRTTYAAQSEREAADAFAAIIARLMDRDAPPV